MNRSIIRLTYKLHFKNNLFVLLKPDNKKRIFLLVCSELYFTRNPGVVKNTMLTENPRNQTSKLFLCVLIAKTVAVYF